MLLDWEKNLKCCSPSAIISLVPHASCHIFIFRNKCMTKKWYRHSAATVALEAGPTEVVDRKGRQLELQGKLE